MNTSELIRQYKQVFDTQDPQLFFSPGRINLIGEHIDYNGGYVFPCAITLGTYAVADLREDREVHVFSKNFEDEGTTVFSLDQIVYDKRDGWANYPKGIYASFLKRGFSFSRGLNIYYYGNIPNQAGLSSSASLELLTGVILEKMYHFAIERLELVKIGQEVENDFIGVNSGIMDQFAVGMGQKDTALLLDCASLEYERVPVVLGDYEIIIMNTNKQRELADSKYNERRSECEQALSLLQKKLSVRHLCDLTEDQFEANQNLIADPVIRRRARHAVSENARTLRAAEKLKKGNLKAFGELLNASHRSLRDDYEVTGKELDVLAEAAWKQDGVLGARMTGAGFGGCAIALVHKDHADAFIDRVGKLYLDQVGYKASFYIASVGDGSKILEKGGIESCPS